MYLVKYTKQLFIEIQFNKCSVNVIVFVLNTSIHFFRNNNVFAHTSMQFLIHVIGKINFEL